MKKYSLFLVFCLFTISLAANDLVKTANSMYKKGNYAEAITLYLQAIPNEKQSPEIFYNIGNAYYKNGNLAKAIVYYERALLIEPNYDDARFNLALVQAKTVDKIDKLDSFFIHRWFDSIANWVSSDVWAKASIILFFSVIALAFLYAFSKQMWLRKSSFYGALIMFLVCSISVFMAKKQKDKIEQQAYAIVMSPTVTVRSAPDKSGTTVFVLHEGTKVKIKSSLDVWVEIVIDDGNVGWMLQTDMEKI